MMDTFKLCKYSLVLIQNLKKINAPNFSKCIIVQNAFLVYRIYFSSICNIKWLYNTPLLVTIGKHVTMLIFSIQPGLAQMSSANGSNNGKWKWYIHKCLLCLTIMQSFVILSIRVLSKSKLIPRREHRLQHAVWEDDVLQRNQDRLHQGWVLRDLG